MSGYTDDYDGKHGQDAWDRPATQRQMADIRRLAAKMGMPEPRTDLTYEEAKQTLHALHVRNDRGEPMPPPAPDPSLQPGETLRNWFPYRRGGERGHGERLA